MGCRVTNGNWTNIFKLSICSASLAALGYYVWKYQHKYQWENSSLWQILADFFSRSKSVTKKTVSVSLDNIETSVEEWIEILKDKYISEETQEVLDSIKLLIGIKA